MCKEYIVDVFDYETIIVSPEFIKCIRARYGVDVMGREFGENYAMTLDSLPESLRDELVDYVLERAKRVRQEIEQLKQRLEEEKKQKQKQQQKKPCETINIHIHITWDLDGLFGGPRRVVSFSLPEDLAREIEETARRLRMSKSELVTKALSSFLAALKRYEDKIPRAPS